MPTAVARNSPRKIAHKGTAVGKPTKSVMSLPTRTPPITPKAPPTSASDALSIRNCMQHVALLGAQRLAHADFARALGDAHQHDVHDHDAADHQRDGAEPEHNPCEDAEQLVGNVEERVVGLEFKVVGLAGRIVPA